MIVSPPLRPPASSPAPVLAPGLATGLEEVCVEGARGVAAGLGFLLSAAGDGACGAGLMVAAPRVWFGERGRLRVGGLAQLGGARLSLDRDAVLMITPATEIEALWALEEGLRSGAVSLAVGAIEAASLLATRRLDWAARAAGASVVLIKTRPARDLSAARRRWRVAQHPSAAHPFDPKASGAPRWRVTLERSRDGGGGAWILEHDLETHRLRLVERLADHGLDLGEQEASPLRRSG